MIILAIPIPDDFTNKKQDAIRDITNPETSQCIIKKKMREARKAAKDAAKNAKRPKRFKPLPRRSERIKIKKSET